MDDVEQIEAMDRMIHSVENFVGSVNNHLTMRQESERLKGVMARIESYDVVVNIYIITLYIIFAYSNITDIVNILLAGHQQRNSRKADQTT